MLTLHSQEKDSTRFVSSVESFGVCVSTVGEGFPTVNRRQLATTERTDVPLCGHPLILSFDTNGGCLRAEDAVEGVVETSVFMPY